MAIERREQIILWVVVGISVACGAGAWKIAASKTRLTMQPGAQSSGLSRSLMLEWVNRRPRLTRPQVEDQFTGRPLRTESVTLESRGSYNSGTRSIYSAQDGLIYVEYDSLGFVFHAGYAR